MPDLDKELFKLRHTLHQHAEVSKKESKTAGLIRDYFSRLKPDGIIENLGGQGLAFIFNSASKKETPRILIRCELDALPIPESIDCDYASRTPGVAHKCGHDGHMTIVAGTARHFSRKPPTRGSIVFLFQPSEETGEGAEFVLNDPKFKAIEPDYAFALHNLPGFDKNRIILRNGTFASASKGFIVTLHGATSHAAEPERGTSPALAVAQIVQALSGVPQFFTPLPHAAQVTIIHAKIGERAFGTSPGEGHVMTTLRSHTPEIMRILESKCKQVAEGIARTFDLDFEISCTEEFPATINDPKMVDAIDQCAAKLGLAATYPEFPFSWSEDFGHFTDRYKGALFGLGAGLEIPALHNPTYDFPDEIIESGINMFIEIVDKIVE